MGGFGLKCAMHFDLLRITEHVAFMCWRLFYIFETSLAHFKAMHEKVAWHFQESHVHLEAVHFQYMVLA